MAGNGLIGYLIQILGVACTTNNYGGGPQNVNDLFIHPYAPMKTLAAPMGVPNK